MSDIIDIDCLSRWLSSDAGQPEWLVGYKLDDCAREWLITGFIAPIFHLSEVAADGVALTGQVKTLPISGVKGDLSIWSESGDGRVIEAIQAIRSPAEVAAEKDFSYVVQAGWPGTCKLGLGATELSSLVRKIGDPSLTIEGVERIASIAEVSKASSLAAARWVERHIELQQGMELRDKVRAKIQISSLYRAGGRYDKAIAATDDTESLTTQNVSASSMVAVWVTRAAAFVDRAETNSGHESATDWLYHAERILKKAFAISNGRPTEYQNAVYGRLRGVQRSIGAHTQT